MELDFTPEQDDLRDGVRAVLERECPMSLVRAVVEDGAVPEALWKHMVELGWPALTIPEALGGLGLGPVELAVVVEELGRADAPGPFVPTVCQFAPAVREAGSDALRQRFLPDVAAGAITGALALTEAGRPTDPAAVQATATRDGSGWTLAGTKRAVLGGDTTDELVVVAREPGTEGDHGVV